MERNKRRSATSAIKERRRLFKLLEEIEERIDGHFDTVKSKTCRRRLEGLLEKIIDMEGELLNLR